MQTHTIPPENWLDFLNKFSRDHEGWLATIEVTEGFQQQPLAVHLAFHGISIDTKGTRPSALQISAGGAGGSHVDHMIDLPLKIREVEDHNGDVHLQIEPARGAPTIIHLRSPEA
jgi:hypothetical protein